MRRFRKWYSFLPVISMLVTAMVMVMTNAAAAEASRTESAGATITPPEPHPWWPSRHAAPAWAIIENARAGDLVQLSLSTRTLIQHGTVRMADAGRHRVEMTVIGSRVPKFTWTADGQSHDAWIPLSRHFTGEEPDGRVWVVALDGTLHREMIAVDPDIAVNGGPSEIKAESVPHTAMPSRWQNYAGFFGTVLATPHSLEAMSREQRTALCRGILWLGVRLWVVGGDTAEVLFLLGVTANARSSADLGGGVLVQRLGNGTVTMMTDGDPRTFFATVAPSAPNDLLSALYDPLYMPGYTWFDDELEGVGVVFILAALVVLGLILGPVNYWFVRRRKNPLLFFILTPVTAVIGGATILFGSAVMEGGGGRFNEHAVLVARSGGDDAVILDYRQVRPGFWLPDVRYSDDTLVLPGRAGQSDSIRILDWTDGIRLGSGWFHSRSVDAYLTARPVVARLAVGVDRESKKWRIRNNLDHDIVSARIYTGNGGVLQAGPVAAGSEVLVDDGAGNSTGISPAEKNRYLASIGFSGDGTRVRLVAECRGIPYIDDGGFGGRRMNGRYYYVLLDETLEARDD